MEEQLPALALQLPPEPLHFLPRLTEPLSWGVPSLIPIPLPWSQLGTSTRGGGTHVPGCVLPARGTSISLCWHQSHCQRCPSVATSAPSPPPPGPACPWWPEPQGATRVSPCLLCPEGLQAGTGGPMALRPALDTPMAPRWLQVPYGQPCSPAAHTAPCPPVCCDPPSPYCPPQAVPHTGPTASPTPCCAPQRSQCVPFHLLCPTKVPSCPLPAVSHTGPTACPSPRRAQPGVPMPLL